MQIKCSDSIKKTNIYVISINEGEKEVKSQLGNDYQKIIKDYVIKKEGFLGKYGEFYLLNNLEGEVDKILVVGLGKNLDNQKARELGAKLYQHIKNIPNNKDVVIEKINNENITISFLSGFLNASYKFDKYKTVKEEEKIKNVTILDSRLKKEVEKCKIINESLNFTKNLINEQAYEITPSKIADIANIIAKENDLEIKIYDKKELEKMNFGAFLAVARGSEQEPKLIHLAYKPKNPVKKVALIGKGITFDSGGLDIKPASSMLDMKDDMSGCACVLGVIQAVKKLNSNIEVHIISALCENMPSGKSYKPGDILTAKNGKTIEVDNTDAEGRLTLADALTYADKLGFDEIIDIATLTGACVVALGNRISGIMGTNKKMLNEIIKKGEEVGEDLWEMPIKDYMRDSLASNIADMRNTGGREAGTSVAGWFLSNFVKNKNWVHIDIAGTAHISKPYGEHSKGATGIMVRTLTNYLT
ncbi:MAG: leucyl aminopeptidase [Cyanobacteria bacterium SIG30]|nr:leucyl aminopeptidase [Cyanobacteria bacterium SIG30]